MSMDCLHTVLLVHNYSLVASVLIEGWENYIIQVCLAGRLKQEAGFFPRKVHVMAPRGNISLPTALAMLILCVAESDTQVSSDRWSEMVWCLGPGCPSACPGPKGNEIIQSLTSKLCSTLGSCGHIATFLTRLRQAQSHQWDLSHTPRAEKPPYLSQSNTQ